MLTPNVSHPQWDRIARPHPHTIARNLNDYMLCDAIDMYAEEIKKSYLVNIDFKSFGFFEQGIPEKIKMNLFRILKKYLTMVIDKGNVIAINIGLSQNKERILLSIADELQPNIAGQQQLVDLTNMAEEIIGEAKIICTKSSGNCFIYKVDLK